MAPKGRRGKNALPPEPIEEKPVSPPAVMEEIASKMYYGPFSATTGVEYAGPFVEDPISEYKYEGYFNISDRRHGQGKTTFVNGDVYEGLFSNGRRSGFGIYTTKAGAKYVGEWDKGKKNGQGVFNYPNGSKYEGTFESDKRHGTGVFTYANRDVYEGEWSDHQRHGQGKYTYYALQLQYVGGWERGERVGVGLVTRVEPPQDPLAESERWITDPALGEPGEPGAPNEFCAPTDAELAALTEAELTEEEWVYDILDDPRMEEFNLPDDEIARIRAGRAAWLVAEEEVRVAAEAAAAEAEDGKDAPQPEAAAEAPAEETVAEAGEAGQ